MKISATEDGGVSILLNEGEADRLVSYGKLPIGLMWELRKALGQTGEAPCSMVRDDDVDMPPRPSGARRRPRRRPA